jgi:hypothetical protein
MSKQKPRDDYERSDSGLWLPRGGIVGPDRRRPDSRRRMPGYPCCCQGHEQGYDCNSCINNKAPATWKLVVSGITNGACSNCLSLNGTYVLTQYSQYNPCLWQYWPPFSISPCPPCCIAVYFYVRLNTTGTPPTYSLSSDVHLSSSTDTCRGCGDEFQFKYESSSPIDCMNFAQQLTRTGTCICTADSVIGGCDLSGIQLYVETG